MSATAGHNYAPKKKAWDTLATPPTGWPPCTRGKAGCPDKGADR